MNELTKKILESGLVDKATAKMLSRWGVIDETDTDLVRENNLKEATREELMRFAEDIEEEVEKRRKMRESMLDLNQIRWPGRVMIYGPEEVNPTCMTMLVDVVVDRMNRYYFRPGDVPRDMLVPGHQLKTDLNKFVTILEVTELSIGDDVVAIQVSVNQ